MQRAKYAPEFKDEAVKQVIDKAELRRTTEERDILKKAAAYFAKQSG
jgi:transposase